MELNLEHLFESMLCATTKYRLLRVKTVCHALHQPRLIHVPRARVRSAPIHTTRMRRCNAAAAEGEPRRN